MIKEIKKEEFDKTFYDLNYEGYLYHYNHRKDIFVEKTYEEIKEYALEKMDKGLKVLGYFKDDKLIGFLSYYIWERATKYLWIDEFEITESERRKGYGTDLMNEVREIVKRENLSRIELNCWAFNEDAIKFYEKLGYVEQRIVFEKINED
jgi:GNAT superfamily N-acetyltransferase